MGTEVSKQLESALGFMERNKSPESASSNFTRESRGNSTCVSDINANHDVKDKKEFNTLYGRITKKSIHCLKLTCKSNNLILVYSTPPTPTKSVKEKLSSLLLLKFSSRVGSWPPNNLPLCILVVITRP